MNPDDLFFNLQGDTANGMVLPAVILIGAYALIMSERVNRAVVALLAGMLAVALGTIDQSEAIAAIDFNTLALLAGTMIIVAVAKKSGIFGYVAVKAVQATRGSPAGSLAALAIVTGVLSAFLNNVTTVMLIVPVTLVVCAELRVRPYPFLFAEIFASNIGGTATLIGDPPNILIGSAVGLSFNDFLVVLAPVVAIVFAVQMLIIHLIWGRTMRSDAADRARIMAMKAGEAIEDRYLLICSLAVLGAVILAFVFSAPLGLEAGTIAMLGAAVLMLLENLPQARDHHNANVLSAFGEIEWITIFFFVGLFIVVGAVEKAGIIDLLAQQLLKATAGNAQVASLSILWGSAVLSALLDNIPFVATMIPLIKTMAPAMGGDAAVLPLWWSLALGACLGGNGTLIGAAANLTVAGIAERSGIEFRFSTFMLLAFPMMLVSIAICHFYILWRFF